MKQKHQSTILIAGYYGFGNTGDEAILSAMLMDLRKERPGLNFIVISGSPIETSNRHHVQSILWTDIAAILDAFQESDLIILGGGGLFHDYWGVSEENILTRSHSGISFYAELPILAAINNKPCMLYAVGVGPLFYNSGKKLTRISFENADIATLRDIESKELLRGLGVNVEKIQVTADPAFNLHSDIQRSQSFLEKGKGSTRIHIGVCLRNWDLNIPSQKWQVEIAEGLKQFANQYNADIVFIPFQVSSSDSLTDDLSTSKNISQLMGNELQTTILEGGYSPEIINGLIAQCDLVVGMRLHSLIFAIKEGIPIVGLIYDPKVKNLLTAFDVEELGLELSSITAKKFFDVLEKSWFARKILSTKLLKKSAKTKKLAYKNTKMVFALLDKGIPANKAFKIEEFNKLFLNQTRMLAILEPTVQELKSSIEKQSKIIIDLKDQANEREIILHASTNQINKHQKTIDVLNAKTAQDKKDIQALKDKIDELEDLIAAQQIRITQNDKMIEVRDEGIIWLRNEIKLMQASRFWKLREIYRIFRTHLAQLTYPIRHPIKWLDQSKFRKTIIQILPNSLKKSLGKIINPATRLESASFSAPMVAEDILDEFSNADFYASINILPSLSENDRSTILKHEISTVPAHPTDIICFSIVDWDTRYQRPQQIMSQFAEKGHRVFYISTSKFQGAESKPMILARNIKKNIFEISLSTNHPPNIYGELIEGKNSDVIHEALKELRQIYRIEDAISYVMISSWCKIALEARQAWGWQMVYDCMDEWNNFPLIKQAIIDAEIQLVQKCDLLIVTSQRLYETWKIYDRPMILVRNATDFEFYQQHYLPNNLLSDIKHPIIGYYGAIAEWFDIELMIYVAEQRPNYIFILLGGIFDVDVSRLAMLPNVKLLGQQPYETMPKYLYSFDVCIIPFKINPITEATDPVKIYEYFSGGKPVVSVALSELKLYEKLLYLAEDQNDFVKKLDEAVDEHDDNLQVLRKEFASNNTWSKRYKQIISGLVSITPRASIIIVTYNNLALTKLCLESIIRNTDYINYEVIVVDNNSTDGTQEYLSKLSEQINNLRVLKNPVNESFAHANNQGLELATGEYLVLLNNDTIAPSGWLNRLMRYLRDPEVGLVGPVTNFVGNEAKVDVNYRTWKQMEEFVKKYTWENEGLAAEIHMLAMYCVAFRREVYKIIGPLDEQFKIGMFEDDDYAQRIREKSYKVICAQDVFVHHFGQSAFKELLKDNRYNTVFEENKHRYEAKWNLKWLPHRHAKLTSSYYPIRVEKQPIDKNNLKAHSKQEKEYVQKLSLENRKWGEHLKVEKSGEWYAWLDHPIINAHYHKRSLIDGVKWEDWVTKKFGGPAQKSLDLGCGAGQRSLNLWLNGASNFIEGVDISEERIAAGEKLRQEHKAPGMFWVGDMNTISIPEKTYDVIFSAHSFHHFLNLEQIMKQVENGLTENGIFILEEFVGPTQFQWTDAQIEHTRDLLRTIPPSLRTFRDGRLKTEEGRPTPEEVEAVSPFESIRSAEIWPLFQKYFEVISFRKIGGTIQHLLYNGIIHNFDIANSEAIQHIQRIYKIEDQLIDTNQIPSDFMLMIGKRRK